MEWQKRCLDVFGSSTPNLCWSNYSESTGMYVVPHPRTSCTVVIVYLCSYSVLHLRWSVDMCLFRSRPGHVAKPLVGYLDDVWMLEASHMEKMSASLWCEAYWKPSNAKDPKQNTLAWSQARLVRNIIEVVRNSDLWKDHPSLPSPRKVILGDKWGTKWRARRQGSAQTKLSPEHKPEISFEVIWPNMSPLSEE